MKKRLLLLISFLLVQFAYGQTIEAEDAELVYPMVIYQDDTASNGQYVMTTDSRKGSLTFGFNIMDPGRYMIQARTMTPGPTTDGHNSFYVGIDDEISDGNEYDVYDLQITESFTWDNMSRRGLGSELDNEFDPFIFELDEGLHTVTFYARESKSMIDQINLIKISDIMDIVASIEAWQTGGSINGVVEDINTWQQTLAQITVNSGDSIQSAINSASNGDIIMVQPGTYNEDISVLGTGITVIAEPRRSAIINKVSLTGTNSRVEGFRIQPSGNGDCADVSGSGNEFVDNFIEECKRYGLKVSGSDNLIQFNYLYKPNLGITISGTNNIIERNEINGLYQYGNLGDCDYSRFFGTGHIIRHNWFHGMIRSEVGSAHVDCFQTFDNYESVNDITIEYNLCTDFSQGIMAEGDDRQASENVISRYNIYANGINGNILRDHFTNVYCNHNTYYGLTYYAIWYNDGEGAGGNINGEADNNIVYDSGTGITVRDSQNIVVNNNLIYDSRVSVSCSTCTESGTIEANPMFIDAANNDFGLQADSPACGAASDGTDIGAIPCGMSMCEALGHVCGSCDRTIDAGGCANQDCCFSTSQSSCGDGTCDASEDCSSCEADCGACGPVCGDGVCEAVEDCTICEADCGVCPCVPVHDADNDPCDGIIDTNELSAYLDQWKRGLVDMSPMMQAIKIWKV